MPRKPRMYVPGLPYHVIQRGNNRGACFFCADDYQFFLQCLHDACKRYGAQLHAYVLMTNHTHLLMTPTLEDSISRVMQSVGRRYVQYVNAGKQRTGTLWESRHKSSVVDTETYLLTCYRYVELNPVRAGIVEYPGDYLWSSFGHNAYARNQVWITEHELYRRLGPNTEDRSRRYRALFPTTMDAAEIKAIRDAATFGMPLGNELIKANIEVMLGRKLGYTQRGRPKRSWKAAKADEN